MVEMDVYNKAFPAKRIAQVAIELKDGCQLVSPATEAIGDPENPVSDGLIEEKFMGLSSAVIGRKRSAELFEVAQDMGSGPSVMRLLSRLNVKD